MPTAIAELELLRMVDRHDAVTALDVAAAFGVAYDAAYRNLERLLQPRHGPALERSRLTRAASLPYEYRLTPAGRARLAEAAHDAPPGADARLIPIETGDVGDAEGWDATEVLVTVQVSAPTPSAPQEPPSTRGPSIFDRKHLVRDVFRTLFSVH